MKCDAAFLLSICRLLSQPHIARLVCAGVWSSCKIIIFHGREELTTQACRETHSHPRVQNMVKASPWPALVSRQRVTVTVTVTLSRTYLSRTCRLGGMVISIWTILKIRNTGMHRIVRVFASDVLIWVDKTFSKDKNLNAPNWKYLYLYAPYTNMYYTYNIIINMHNMHLTWKICDICKICNLLWKTCKTCQLYIVIPIDPWFLSWMVCLKRPSLFEGSWRLSQWGSQNAWNTRYASFWIVSIIEQRAHSLHIQHKSESAHCCRQHQIRAQL